MKNNYNKLTDLIIQAEEKAKQEVIDMEKFSKKSLAELISEQWDRIEFLLAFYKKKNKSGYRDLSALFATRGVNVSESTLRTTICRINVGNGKQQAKIVPQVPPVMIKVVAEITPPEPVEPMPINQKSEPIVEIFDEPEPFYYVDGVNDEMVEDYDWSDYAEIIQYEIADNGSETRIFRMWQEKDQTLYDILFYMAMKNKCSIRMLGDTAFFFEQNEDKIKSYKHLIRKAEWKQKDIDIPETYRVIGSLRD